MKTVTKRHRIYVTICGRLLITSFVIFLLLFSQLTFPSAFDPLPADSSSAITDELEGKGKARIIVGLKLPHRPEGKLTRSEKILQRANIRAQQNALIKELKGGNAHVNARFESIAYLALTVDSNAYDALKRSPRVSVIELDEPAQTTLSTSNPIIGSPNAWNAGYDGAGYSVAVLDTGVDKAHPWFTTGGAKVISEACYSSSQLGQLEPLCPGGLTESTSAGSGVHCTGIDGCDHGTHVAGIVAGNDGSGPDHGVARGSDIIAIQVFTRILDPGLCGSSPTPCVLSFTSDQIRGLERVLALNGAYNIASVNMSIGGGGYTSQASCDANNSAIKAAIDNLRSVGIATVVASGNNGYINALNRPACISSAISVGATTDADQVAYFSNIADFIDLLAPGTSINSSVPGGGTAFKQGTSMAAPHVAGAWAVLKQVWPLAGVDDLEGVLKSEATLVDDSRGGGTVTGMGRINLDLSVDSAIQLSQGTLGGTVVDAADGVTPVYPVAIDLADPLTGEWLAISVTNEPDGSWELSGLAPGWYKVLFNAFGPANGYADELHDGVRCDNGACDIASLGAAVDVAAGSNTLDVDLERVFLISGTVTDASSDPIKDAVIQVFDAFGGPAVGGVSSTDQNGIWSQPVVDPGNYYAHVIESGRTEYVHEVWNDKPCDGCDPVATGDAIVVSAGDVPNIDFQLDYGGGTLNGVIVDADDGVTPVFPVRIDLVNSLTGEWEGFAAENSADGSYSLQGIPPGDYKVFFNAGFEAETWVDELHDDVPCPDALCDRALLGTSINIMAGENVLDASLSRLSISGTVLDENSQPLQNVAVDVLDENGFLVAPGAAFTDGNGDWLKYLPGPGIYYVRTVGQWTPSHQPEIWLNTPCDACNPLIWGTPIEVGTDDISGIDFQLDPRPQVQFSGTVVDAQDGITPVHPVAVDLLDPVTGATLGLVAETDETGRFTFTDIPVGPYKIFFNAHDAADSYHDELYNNIECIDFGCDASAQGGVVHILPGYSEVHVDLYTPTSVNGTILDEIDGETPITSVVVSLHDTVTGDDIPDLWGITGPDGTYTISNVPPGEYLVIFNALNESNDYKDELYDEVPCDNGACDRVGEGKVFKVSPGQNLLDARLRYGITLSGRVTDELDSPMPGLTIEVFDAAGNPVCCNATTDEQGDWWLSVPRDQDYFARVANIDLNGYLPEVWNDRKCIDCDPISTGTPIVVNNTDIGGIDFELKKPKEALKACSSSGDADIILRSDFEHLPERKIIFTNSVSALLTGEADEANFEVELLDENDVPVDESDLIWCLTDDTMLDLVAEGGNATVTATGFELGSSDLVVRDPNSGAEARAPLVFAELAENALMLDSADILEGSTPEPGTTGIIRLNRTPVTEALLIGTVISTTASSNILVRILNITLLPGEVELLVEPAALEDLYYSIIIDTKTTARSLTIPIDGQGVAQQSDDQEALAGQGIPVLGIFDLSCSGGLNIPNFQAEPPQGDFDIRDLQGYLKIERVEGITYQFDAGAKGVIEANVKLGRAELQGGINGRCSLKLNTAGRTLLTGVLGMALNAPGVALGLTFNPRFQISTRLTEVDVMAMEVPLLQIKQKFNGGIRAIIDPFSDPEFEVYGSMSGDNDMIGIKMTWPTVQISFDAEMSVTGGVILEPAGFGMHTWSAGPKFKFSMIEPVDPLHQDYRGPNWQVSTRIVGSWDSAFQTVASKICGNFLGKVFRNLTSCSWYNFRPGLEVPIWESEPVTQPEPHLYASCRPEDCPIDVELSEWLDYRIDAGGNDSWFFVDLDRARVRLVGWKDDNAEGVLLNESISNIPYNSSWYPEGIDAGHWKFKAQLRPWDLDDLALSGFLPYAEKSFTRIFLGNQHKLNVEINGQGTVTSDPRGLNCPRVCEVPVADGNSVILFSGPDPGWWFKEWHTDGECGGSTNRSCQVTMNAVKTAIAVFAPNPVISVEVHDQDGPNSSVGTVSSTPGGINCGPICSSPVVKDSAVTLKAAEIEGWLFDHWEACPAAVDHECTLTMTADASVTAVFRPKPQVVIVDKVDLNGALTLKGWITSSPAGIDCGPDCEGEFVNFATIQLTATAYGDWEFRRWATDSEACAGSTNPFCVVPLNKDVNRVKAVFSPGERKLTVQKVDSGRNPVNQGKVTSNPAGIMCGIDCEEDFQLGSNITLTAADQGVWVFKKWADDSAACASSTNEECIVPIDSDKTVKAEFERLNYELAVLGRKLDYGGGSNGFYEHTVLQDGQTLNLFPGGLYTFQLKLDGVEIPTTCFTSPSFENEGACHDLGGTVPCRETASTDGFTVRFVRNQYGSLLVYGGTNYQAPGVTITIHDANNNRDVTFTLNVWVVTAQYQAVNEQTFSITDSQGVPTGDTLTFHQAERAPILAGYYGNWTATTPWGRDNLTSGWWAPWFRNSLYTFTKYVCPDQSVKDVVFYGTAQLYETVYCHNQKGDWLICSDHGCSTDPYSFLICPAAQGTSEISGSLELLQSGLIPKN